MSRLSDLRFSSIENRQAGMPAVRAVNASRTISMIASLTSLLTFIGIDGMGHVNGHNVDRSTLHQGQIFSSFSFLYMYFLNPTQMRYTRTIFASFSICTRFLPLLLV